MLTSLSVRARLNGTPTLSPALFGTVGLVVAKWDASGAYVSRETTGPVDSGEGGGSFGLVGEARRSP